MEPSVQRVTNAVDGVRYQISVVEQRKWVAAEEQDLFYDRTTIKRRRIDAEAAIWSGSWLRLWFKPKLVIYITPDVPPRFSGSGFRVLVRQIVERVDLTKAENGEFDAALKEICEPHELCPIYGVRRIFFTMRRVPSLFLMEWPASHKSPYPGVTIGPRGTLWR